MSTTGATADCEFAFCAGAGVAGVVGAVAVWVTVVRVVTGRLGAGAGRAAAVRVARVTVLVWAVVVLTGAVDVEDSVAVVSVVLVSGVVGAASVAGGVVTGGVCATGSVGDVVVGTCWASNGVEESARAAAIAGRALVRALSIVVFNIMPGPTRARGLSATVIVVSRGNPDEPSRRRVKCYLSAFTAASVFATCSLKLRSSWTMATLPFLPMT